MPTPRTLALSCLALALALPAAAQEDARAVAGRRGVRPSASRRLTPATPAPAAGAGHGGVHAPGGGVVPAVPPTAGSGICAETVRDQADPQNCVTASSVPALGSLYPLGPELNIDPAGLVGINTLNPAYALDVVGDVRGDGRAAFGNMGQIGSDGLWTRVFDLSHSVTDFSPTVYSTPFRSSFLIDPQSDLTGPDDKWIFSHYLSADIPAGNAHDLKYLQAPWMGTANWGDGTVEILAGILSAAEAFGNSRSIYQVGASVVSDASHSATIENNYYLDVWGGHAGVGGEIVNDYGIYLRSPYHARPLQNHYGLYLEDQDFGVNDSYAIFSEGGTCYFEGDVGIGTKTPGYKLQVGEPGDGSEARANAWNLLSSREHKRDVEALEPEECEAILAELVAQDVVRYKYKADEDGEEHLGVIAEDSPEAILGKDRKAISLGDWTAFLMAGLKAQQRRIDELEAGHAAELAALREELAALRADLARR